MLGAVALATDNWRLTTLMDFEQLETFSEVARHASFSRAAEKRFRTRAALAFIDIAVKDIATNHIAANHKSTPELVQTLA